MTRTACNSASRNDHQSAERDAIGQLPIIEDGFDARPKVIDSRVERIEFEGQILAFATRASLSLATASSRFAAASSFAVGCRVKVVVVTSTIPFPTPRRDVVDHVFGRCSRSALNKFSLPRTRLYSA